MYFYKLTNNTTLSKDNSILISEKEYTERDFVNFIANILYDHKEENLNFLDLEKYLVKDYNFKILNEIIAINISSIFPKEKR